MAVLQEPSCLPPTIDGTRIQRLRAKTWKVGVFSWNLSLSENGSSTTKKGRDFGNFLLSTLRLQEHHKLSLFFHLTDFKVPSQGSLLKKAYTMLYLVQSMPSPYLARVLPARGPVWSRKACRNLHSLSMRRTCARQTWLGASCQVSALHQQLVHRTPMLRLEMQWVRFS